MLPDGHLLRLIRKYNRRLLYWAIVLIVSSVIPHLHSLGKPQAIAQWDYLIISIFIMIALNNAVKYLIWNSKPVLHPVCKYLRKCGDLEELVTGIDKGIKAEAAAESDIYVTDLWIIHQGFIKFRLIPLADVIWYYIREPIGKRYKAKSNQLVVHTKDEKIHFLKYRRGRQGSRPEAAINRRAPWAYAGYSEKTAELWRKNRREMIEDVMKKAEKFTAEGEN
jgi:hypothetical protein